MCQEQVQRGLLSGVAERDTESTDSTRGLDFSSNRKVVLLPAVSCAVVAPHLRLQGVDGFVKPQPYRHLCSSDPDRSILKRNADEIALPPDHAARANGVKIVEAQFEIQRQRIEGIKFDSGPGICDVLNAAGEDTALCVKEQPRVFRDRRSCHISAFGFHQHYQPFTPGRAGRG
jgi:hypothetical protein